MVKKLRNWIRRLIFDLLRDDIKGLIVQEVCHLDPPTTTKGSWEIKAPTLLERPKAQDCTYGTHRSIPNSLEVHYFSGLHKKKACIPCPPEGTDIKSYLLARPEANL